MAMDERDPHSQELCRHYSIDRFPISPETTQRARRAYFGMISDIDQKIGRILEALADAGLAETTAIVFTSDHGDMLGERGLWMKKTFFEWALRIPLIVVPPGGGVGRRIARPVSHQDLLPTLVQLAGGRPGQIVDPSDGASLLPDVLGDGGERDLVLAEHLDEGTSAPRFMVRKGAHKAVFSPGYPTQLYDLAADPDELDDRAQSPALAGVLDELRAIAAQTWDPVALTEQILANQRRRALVHAALGQGRWTAWDYQPPPPDETRYVRHNDVFPAVERRGYLPYGG